MDAIKAQQFFYPGGDKGSAVLGKDQAAVLAEQLTQIYGRAGAKLRAGRITGEHLDVLGRMLSGEHQDIRVDMTQGRMATATVGGRFVHIPVADELSATVNIAGVKYAPMQNVVFDQNSGSYRVLTSTQSLAADMEDLLKQGISEHAQSRRARYASKAVSKWQEQQLLFVRGMTHEAGGALPFYISKQATIRSGPLFEQAKRVEELTLRSITATKWATRGARVSRAGFEMVGGQRVARSYALQRQAMIEHLGLSLGMLSAADAEGRQLFPSLGVKSLRLRGEDIFGNKRSSDGSSRLIVSTLPTAAYGLFAPGKQLAKGIHFLRAAMSAPTAVVTALRAHEAEVAARQGLKLQDIRNSRVFMSAVDMAAEESLQHHSAMMGGRGAQQLMTPMSVGFVQPAANLTAQERQAAMSLIHDVFGDSGVLSTSRSGSELVAGPLRSTKKILQTYTGEAGVYAQGRMHPLIEQEIRKAGMGGYIAFENPITAEMLGETHGIKGWVGRQSTSTGAEKMRRRHVASSLTGEPIFDSRPSDVTLTGREQITGASVSRGKLKFHIERMGREGELQLGTAEYLGGKRVGVHGAMRSIHGVDRLAAGVAGWGPDMGHLDTQFQTLGQGIFAAHGEEGLENFAKQMGYSTRRNAMGQLAVIPNFDTLTPEHMEEVKRVSHTFGIALPPNVPMGADELEFERRASPETRALIRKTSRRGSLLEVGVRTADWTGRAGQPQRGTFGNVEVRVRDQRVLATKLAGMSGMSVQDMRGNAAQIMGEHRKSFSGGGAKWSAAKTTRMGGKWGGSLTRYLDRLTGITGVARDPIQQALLLEEYLAGGATGALPKELPAGMQIERITAKAYRERSSRKIGRLSHESTMEDLKGTPFVTDAGEASQKWYLVTDLEKGGLLPAQRRAGTGGYAIGGVVVPPGQALGLKKDERIRLRKVGGETGGLAMGHQRAAYELHDRLMSGVEPASVYEAHGAMVLAMAEKGFARGGAYHHAHITPKASFFGTLTPDAQLKPHQISMSSRNVEELLRRQGMTETEASAYVKQMRMGKRSYYTQFKIEPMRSGYDVAAMEVKVRSSKRSLLMGGGDVVERRGQTIGTSPSIMPWLHRDYDYDQGMLWNLAGGEGLTFKDEQRVLRMVHKRDRRFLTAAAAEVQENLKNMSAGDVVNQAGKKAAQRSDYSGAITEAVKMMEQRYGLKVTMDARLQAQAMAFTLVSQPEMATAAANLRYRSAFELTSDIALSNSMDVFSADHNVDMNSAVIQDAIGTLRKDREAIEHVRVLGRESEYWTLQKVRAEQMFGSAEEFAKLADPRLATSVLSAGTARGAANVAKAEAAIADNIVDVLGESDVNPLNVMLRAQGMDPAKLTAQELRAAHMNLARPMASVLRATSTLSAEGVRSMQEQFMSTGATSIRDPMLDMVARYHGRAPVTGVNVSDATGAGVGMAGPVTFDPARMAAEANEAASRGGTIKAQAIEFAAGAKAAVQRLMKSKWGAPIALGGGALAAFGIGRALFRSSAPAYAPMGSPVPPNPMVQGIRDDRTLDYNDIPTESYARIQRVNQVRTHMQISGDSTYNNPSGFTGSADLAYGRHGRMPSHGGQFIDDGGGLADRQKVQEMIRRRMMSDHG